MFVLFIILLFKIAILLQNRRNKMSNFEEQMRLFEAEVGGAAVPRFPPRPAFLPHAVRVAQHQHHHPMAGPPPHGAAIPPPPTYPRPATIHPTTARPGRCGVQKPLSTSGKKFLFNNFHK